MGENEILNNILLKLYKDYKNNNPYPLIDHRDDCTLNALNMGIKSSYLTARPYGVGLAICNISSKGIKYVEQELLNK